jgi:hypothetical protein
VTMATAIRVAGMTASSERVGGRPALSMLCRRRGPSCPKAAVRPVPARLLLLCLRAPRLLGRHEEWKVDMT